MINLMPPADKQAFMYARRNSVLIKWMMGIIFAAMGIILVAGGGIFYLKQDTTRYRGSIEESKASLAVQKEQETLARVTEMSGNLKLVTDVLSKQVLFSELLQQIGLIMPPRTVLQDLSLTDALQGGIDLTIGAASEEAAAQAQVNFSDKSKGIFERADINSLNCDEDAADTGYPCTVTIRALFIDDENNPFLLLNKEDD